MGAPRALNAWAHRLPRSLAAAILDSADRLGWVCSTPRGLESPGLMTGLAGIGYALLRIAEPERVLDEAGVEPESNGELGGEDDEKLAVFREFVNSLDVDLPPGEGRPPTE